MKIPVENKNILVILGGTGKIGIAIVEHFLYKGWKVYSLSRMKTNSENIRNLKAQFLKNFKQLKVDCTNSQKLLNAKKLIKKENGTIDLLVNCLGGLCCEEKLINLKKNHLQDVFNLNFFSVVNSCNIFLPIIQSGGTIINFSGGGAIADQANGTFIAYPCAKTALLRFTEIISNQLKKDNIKVYAIDPGWVPSPEDWQNIKRENENSKVDLAYIREAKETPPLIEALYENDKINNTGKLYKVFDDYKKILNKKNIKDSFLKLRLVEKEL